MSGVAKEWPVILFAAADHDLINKFIYLSMEFILVFVHHSQNIMEACLVVFVW